jgi:hypothetical protein
MSQVDLGVAANPAVPTSFPTDSGTAVPAANALTVLGASSTENDVDGIRTVGSGATLTIQLTNRFSATASTSGAVTADLITFNLGGSAQVFRFIFEVACRDTGSGDGNGYTITSTFQTNGTTASRVNTPFSEDDESASIVTSGVDMVASGNSAILRVTGTAGRSLNWRCVGEYLQV